MWWTIPWQYRGKWCWIRNVTSFIRPNCSNDNNGGHNNNSNEVQEIVPVYDSGCGLVLPVTPQRWNTYIALYFLSLIYGWLCCRHLLHGNIYVCRFLAAFQKYQQHWSVRSGESGQNESGVMFFCDDADRRRCFYPSSAYFCYTLHVRVAQIII